MPVQPDDDDDEEDDEDDEDDDEDDDDDVDEGEILLSLRHSENGFWVSIWQFHISFKKKTIKCQYQKCLNQRV